MQTLILKPRVQTIIFQTKENELGTTYATSEKRISIAEAKDILLDREIEYEDILKVKYEIVNIEIPLTEFEKYITL